MSLYDYYRDLADEYALPVEDADAFHEALELEALPLGYEDAPLCNNGDDHDDPYGVCLRCGVEVER